MYRVPMVSIIFQPQERWLLGQREARSYSTAWMQLFTSVIPDQPRWQLMLAITERQLIHIPKISIGEKKNNAKHLTISGFGPDCFYCYWIGVIPPNNPKTGSCESSIKLFASSCCSLYLWNSLRRWTDLLWERKGILRGTVIFLIYWSIMWSLW